jgi:YD repeat-containing protein
MALAYFCHLMNKACQLKLRQGLASPDWQSVNAQLIPQSITINWSGTGLKTLGHCETPCTSEKVGTAEANPINAVTGNKFQAETDFVGGPATGLLLTRFYNSADFTGSAFGPKWRSTWHRELGITPDGSLVTATREDGRKETFRRTGAGVYIADADVTNRLTPVLDAGKNVVGWQLVTTDDAVETYASSGLLTSVMTRAGRVTRLAYDAAKRLTTVTGPFGHTLTFSYDSGNHIIRMTAPDDGAYLYAYSTGNLASVTHPDLTIRRYAYENADFRRHLTGIIDENGNRFATWAYDAKGRAISSQHAGGADLTKLAYNADGTTTVTDARSNTHSYAFVSRLDMTKPSSLTGAPVQTAGGKAFTYDSNGFIASRTDFDGNVTKYTHDARGNQTARVEASGTQVWRSINTGWLSTFHLPTHITEPNRTTAFTYDAHGNLLTKTIAAGGVTRVFSYTYNADGQVLTATDPRGSVTHYAYDAEGNLASITDALGHVTSFMSYDGAGRPLTIKDPNGVTTSLTYDLRGRLTSRTEGTLKTVYAYDKVGNPVRVTLPDSSYLAFTYDAAHRLTGITDALGNHIAYTLDAASNRTSEQVLDPSGALWRTRSYTYDSVNRLSKIIGAQSQTTLYAYDAQSNLTGVTDPLSHTTHYAYDALNRLAQAIDPNGGATSYGYTANDHLASVTDPRGLKTSYGWDGLDDQTSVTSPDTGVTTKSFDAAGNVVTSTDARGKTTTYSYDALNRRTKALFADGTSITWQYDLWANGIGRLSKVIDSSGGTAFLYDANGHVIVKNQVIGAVTRMTSYGYDTGGRLASVTTPSGMKVTYAYDAAGRVSSVTANGQTVASGVTYLPFGGVSGWTAGNGTAYRRTFDLDGRVTASDFPPVTRRRSPMTPRAESPA